MQLNRLIRWITPLCGAALALAVAPGLSHAGGLLGDSGISLPSSPPSLPVKAPSLPVKTPSLPVKAPSLPVKAPSLSVNTPSLSVKAPSLPFKAPSLGTKPPSLSVKPPSLSVKPPSLRSGERLLSSTAASARKLSRTPALSARKLGRTAPAMIDARPLSHWMATTKPFPNATLGNKKVRVSAFGRGTTLAGKGKLAGRYPYEIGMRNTTVSDLAISAAFLAAGPANPILSKGAPWSHYLLGKAAEGGISGLYKKANSNKPRPVVTSNGDPRNPNTYVMSARSLSRVPRR